MFSTSYVLLSPVRSTDLCLQLCLHISTTFDGNQMTVLVLFGYQLPKLPYFDSFTSHTSSMACGVCVL